ncbi:hypothetical protein TanjilG_29646 [Lupinus angustifolius]|uniref:Uncharacterized protein n=1 Tax=Lupinus angustifolius TaxID=3871 RepID=A0A4P1R6I0_LUPAN|nr:PREDICTED: uncharacterized protein LOC109359226 [Lupinus angustifolius]OIW02870.1 hypothetical protein TanjilG_29646 [Lupinus angustifolius]
MADFAAPSFSLGFDLSFDSHQSPPLSPSPHHNHHRHDEDFPPQVPDSDPETGPDPPRRILKRLRRAPPHLCFDVDDDIQEFSSQDDVDDGGDVVQGAHACWSARNHSVCSSSKVSLKGCGVLTPYSLSNSRERKRKQASDIPISLKMETGQSGLTFTKLTTTPSRRFQLLDSNSDDPVGEHINADHKTDSCSKEATHSQSKAATFFEQNCSAKMEMGQSALKVPKITISPLRRFHLIDSDDPVGEDVSADRKIDPCSKEATYNQSKPVTSIEQNGSARMEMGQSGFNFPKLKSSPLRRFQLIDSDSDDPAVGHVSAAQKIDPYSKDATCKKSTAVNSFEHSGSARTKTGQSAFLFPKFASSPLRRFQLIDSDSDDPVDEDVSAAHKIDPCSKYAAYNQSEPVTSSEKSRKMPFDMKRGQGLLKYFSPLKNFSIPTPALNEVCEEYFRSAKDKEVENSGIDISESHPEMYFGVNSSCQKDQQLWESSGPLPPAHRYFFHEVPRIQQLVHRRLCNFSPLGVNRVNQQPNVSHIDYVGQFGCTCASKTHETQKGFANSSIRGASKSANLTVEETFDASGGWVDPKISSPFSNGESSRQKTTKRNSRSNVSKGKNKTEKSTSSNVSCSSSNWVEPKRCSNMPKDAGKRRVQASAQSSGHWYTSDGRKVYVSKSGQELTGPNAYKQYRKESGAGFKKSKAKTSAKKTNSKKRS